MTNGLFDRIIDAFKLESKSYIHDHAALNFQVSKTDGHPYISDRWMPCAFLFYHFQPHHLGVYLKRFSSFLPWYVSQTLLSVLLKYFFPFQLSQVCEFLDKYRLGILGNCVKCNFQFSKIFHQD